MKLMGGNITAQLQMKTGYTKNEIGEKIQTWETIHTLTGWLDLSSGSTNHTVYNAKVQESTHVFICDFVQLDKRITAENSRLIVKGDQYEVTLIDNPMELNYHLEIYLKYTGGVANG